MQLDVLAILSGIMARESRGGVSMATITRRKFENYLGLFLAFSGFVIALSLPAVATHFGQLLSILPH
jgi:hypothetical protein